ncbi:MAG: hypothetical protein P1U36_02310 [Legionellaceae bacterium]|nr:hypothetical protein [Legionellaceae bacterium]
MSDNDLGRKTGAELAEAFAGIPAGVTSLNLSDNDLGRKTGAELAEAFAGIPAGVTSLYLIWNGLGDKTGAELAVAFAGIPAGVTSLDLSENNLSRKTGAELAVAFAGIPAGVTSLNLSWNNLGRKTSAELAVAFAGIPAGVTVSFKGDDLFRNKTRAEKDALLTKLRQASPNINLDLSGNGESDVQRAVTPLACLAKKPLHSSAINTHIPEDVLINILSFLLPHDAPSPLLHTMFLTASQVIHARPSVNDAWGIGRSFPLHAFHRMFGIPQAPEGVLLIKNAEVILNEGDDLQQDGVSDSGELSRESAKTQVEKCNAEEVINEQNIPR